MDSPVGSISIYSAGPQGEASGLPPLLLIHSINAAASAAEVEPLFTHYRQQRPVYAIELPGFGLPLTTKTPYSNGVCKCPQQANIQSD